MAVSPVSLSFTSAVTPAISPFPPSLVGADLRSSGGVAGDRRCWRSAALGSTAALEREREREGGVGRRGVAGTSGGSTDRELAVTLEIGGGVGDRWRLWSVKEKRRRANISFVLAWLKEMLLLDGMLPFRGAMILLSGIIEGTD
ncbi:hypothetical protein E2562_037008 [Oryza meyeriana var. granulata]|uniref:Uncharacterized protein n=1 Tax=Oryza meyeriana var. granulata TaxID=110450 RepID=A0A6G1CXH3_9ORYZ|nr:hypothetical protein E2562_037008 [Oryza meyeriana var. granulata]